MTFGTAIAAYIPIANHIIKNQNFNAPITEETIILSIISAFCVVFKDTQTEELKKYIKENNLSDIINYFIKSIKSFKNIYEFLMKFNSIEFLTDTFSYTAILAPFMLAINDIIHNQLMSMDEIIGCGMSISAGIITMTTKNIIKLIWNKFSKKIKSGENIITEGKLKDVEINPTNVKYRNEIYPNFNYPKRFIGKGKHKYRVLAREGDKVKPINFGDKNKKEKPLTKLDKKYWENLPYWK